MGLNLLQCISLVITSTISIFIFKNTEAPTHVTTHLMFVALIKINVQFVFSFAFVAT